MSIKIAPAPFIPAKKTVLDDPTTLVEAIRKISESMASLERSGLNRKAIVVLCSHDCKVTQRDIGVVLDSLAVLERRYTARR